VKVIEVGEISTYVPDGHWGMEARKLAAGDPLEMMLCVMQPGGGATAHQHDDRPQMLLVIDGLLTITAGEGTPVDVPAGHAAWFQPGEPHAVVNQQSTPARYLAVSVIPG
jgi:quercetin dioxygenase-like cupin family protein